MRRQGASGESLSVLRTEFKEGNGFDDRSTAFFNILCEVYGLTSSSVGRATLTEPPLQVWPVNTLLNYTETVNGVSFKMIRVQGGTFTIGCAGELEGDCEHRKIPAPEVTLSDYSIGETVVTVGQFKVFVESTGYMTMAEKKGWSWVWKGDWVKDPNKNWRHDARGNLRSISEHNHPVLHVSWNDAVEFCGWLSAETKKAYRLPTEAEWEFAARGGRNSRGYKYSGSNDIEEVAWHRYNSGTQTHAVKEKKGNELGLYDMSGNVWEWCSDWIGAYISGSQRNPTGPADGNYRVRRGGDWRGYPERCQVSFRAYDHPTFCNFYIGFRLASH